MVPVKGMSALKSVLSPNGLSMGFRTLNLLTALLFSLKDGAIKIFYVTFEYPVHLISGTV